MSDRDEREPDGFDYGLWVNCVQCGWFQPYVSGQGCEHCGIWPPAPEQMPQVGSPHQQQSGPDDVLVSLRDARLIRSAFLPRNPRKMRGADPEVVRAAETFIAAVDGTAPQEEQSDGE